MIDTIAVRLAIAIVLFATGIYLLICAIKVKGLVYSNSALHTSDYYPQYVKIVRFFCFALPAFFTANLVTNIASYLCQAVFTTQLEFDKATYTVMLERSKDWYGAGTATLVASIVIVVTMIVVAIHLTNKYGQATNEKLSGSHPAFSQNNKDKDK